MTMLYGYLAIMAVCLVAAFAVDKEPDYRTILVCIFWPATIFIFIGLMIRFWSEKK